MEVLPDLKTWNEGSGIGPEDWLSMFGSVPQALMYSALFWPTFVEHQGCLLREGFSPELFEDWLLRTNGDRTAVELVMNHRHITDFFPNTEEQPSPEQIASLGHLLREIWALKLTRDFPSLDIQVVFSWQDLEDDSDAQLLVSIRRENVQS